MRKNTFHHFLLFSIVAVILLIGGLDLRAAEVFSAEDLLRLRGSGAVEISPDGAWIAYTVSTQRETNDKPGPSYSELFLLNVKTRQVKPFITGKISVRALQWSPDSRRLGFVTSRGEKAKSQVWAIAVDGGEAIQITNAPTGVGQFNWHPSQNKIAYISSDEETPEEKKLKDKGFEFIYYEENLKHDNLYLLDLAVPNAKPVQLTKDITVRSFLFSPDGATIAAAMVEKNLVDYDYMFQRVYLLEVASLKTEKIVETPGKLGNFEFSPDGTKLAYAAALDRKDHAVSQVFVLDLKTKEHKNLTIPDFRGHVSGVAWKDAKTVMYYAGEGVWATLSLVPATGGARTIILDGKTIGVDFGPISFAKDFKHAAFSGSNPTNPGEVYYWQPGQKSITKLTDLNPWVKDRLLGKQEIVRFPARDGLEIEGLLIYPVDYSEGQSYPLIVTVHGGPESHYANQWLTRYAEPGQVMAGKGYAVFYPNYRASTGYGVKFALAGYEDPAGKEFDDLADSIDYLVKKGIADPERVGLGGGSYGGYAAAWFGTYYTKYVRAVCMFVGISDLISKQGTTDIPYEELYVHSGKRLEDAWEMNLKRSPIYYAHQSKTAVLIFGGAADTRVHPTQSIELYRRLKMNQHPAVRLVQYPGEGHGNRNQTGRIDVLYRILQWYDWYVKDKKPLDGGMPPLDLSKQYGIN